MTAANTHQLLSEVLDRYGSVEAFCLRLRSTLDEPSDELSGAAALEPDIGGRHRRNDPV